tara:strand:+ start:491 stop:967 length:477 start_codon:yes stop_codon:yes gene_type:complete
MKNIMTKALKKIGKNKFRYTEFQNIIWQINNNKGKAPRGYYCTNITEMKRLGIIKQDNNKKYYITKRGFKNIETPYKKGYDFFIEQNKKLSKTLNKTFHELNRIKYSQLNDVNDKQCIDAIEYLFEQGFVDEMTTDKRYYTNILLNKVANVLGIKLVR